MADGNTISITDRDAFPGRVRKIKQASVNLRAYGDELGKIVESAKKEASSFTADGSVAPAYEETIAGLTAWHTAVKTAIEALCDSADNCESTITAKFKGITGTDIDTSGIIKQL
ncbi:hypothetical protein ACT17_14875 [Mycolicibacterium conceptionense]|uniref:Uncharacterized protein n=1 Tax=Mycolicibacterium conceptionense TaxID=451644 RepID=A0A0J8U991_9MYCO|nr:hypothetical protein [Mycolicibacterium conceptionense]KMV17577.1 hypothetical protein ACT17_14875 [Mycolicibacterium conceptionense]